MSRSLLVFLGAVSLLGLGCDEKSPGAGDASPSVAQASVEAPKVAEPKKAPPKLVMYVDASGVGVGGQFIDSKRDDLEAAIAAALASGTFTIADPLEISVARQVLVPTVRALVRAVRAHGDKHVVLKTASRSGDLVALPIVLESGSIKKALASGIGKDASIAIWPASGGAARKKSHGLAGPDLTLGGEMLGKSVQEGDAIVYNAEDSVQWGRVFDLAMTRVEYKNASTAPIAIATGAYEPGKKVSY